MTYRDLQKRLKKLTEEQLDQDVMGRTNTGEFHTIPELCFANPVYVRDHPELKPDHPFLWLSRPLYNKRKFEPDTDGMVNQG